MNKTRWAMVASGGVLALLWAAMVMPSTNGYGYHGYNRYQGGGFWLLHSGSSTPYYSTASARSGSRGGPNVSGKGLRGGK